LRFVTTLNKSIYFMKCEERFVRKRPGVGDSDFEIFCLPEIKE